MRTRRGSQGSSLPFLRAICSLLEVVGHCCSALLLPRFSCRLQARQFDEEINFTSSEGFEGMRVFYIEPELFFVFSLLTLFMAVSRPTSKFGLRHWPLPLRKWRTFFTDADPASH